MKRSRRPSRSEANSADYVVRAAITCYERYGVHRTSMDDIAREAGVSRAALYYHFPNRDALLAEVLHREVDRVLNDLEATLVDRAGGLATLVDAIELLVKAALNDEYTALYLGAVDTEVTTWVGSDPRMVERQARFWKPLLDAARTASELRNDLSDEEILEFIAVTEVTLIISGPRLGIVDDGARRRYLDRFVRPALASSAAGTPL